MRESRNRRYFFEGRVVFLITQDEARAVLQAAVSTGADFAELYMEDVRSNNVTVLQGEVEDAGSSHRHGAGVRVFAGLKSAYAYTADTSHDSLLATARAAAAAVRASSPAVIAPFAAHDYRIVPRIPFADVTGDRRVKLALAGYAAAKSYSPEIVQARVMTLDRDADVLIANTEGVFARDRRVRMRFVVQAVASDGHETQTGHEGPGYGLGFEGFDRIDPEYYAKKAAACAVTMLHAPACPAASLPVVMDGGFGGVIFHEACGHSLEATSVSRGNSEFCGKLGQKIAADCVSAVDDGTLDGEWGSIHVDDEGTPARRNLLIDHGVLVGYLVDRLGGRRMNMPVTGSSRRQDYTFAPTSRMTNTFICPGEDDEEAMISSCPEGLYAKSMGGGSVNPLTGEFNFAVSEGYWIRDGKILTPVRGATLIGRGADVIRRIDRVGHTMTMGQGMCGSQSGSVPTNVGQPRIRVSELTIGGKGGAL